MERIIVFWPKLARLSALLLLCLVAGVLAIVVVCFFIVVSVVSVLGRGDVADAGRRPSVCRYWCLWLFFFRVFKDDRGSGRRQVGRKFEMRQVGFAVGLPFLRKRREKKEW
jgi:hypothetical protein